MASSERSELVAGTSVGLSTQVGLRNEAQHRQPITDSRQPLHANGLQPVAELLAWGVGLRRLSPTYGSTGQTPRAGTVGVRGLRLPGLPPSPVAAHSGSALGGGGCIVKRRPRKTCLRNPHESA
jgi:hypothetical protein